MPPSLLNLAREIVLADYDEFEHEDAEPAVDDDCEPDASWANMRREYGTW